MKNKKKKKKIIKKEKGTFLYEFSIGKIRLMTCPFCKFSSSNVQENIGQSR